MARPQIFISYRRDDTAGYARAVYDALAAALGADEVFIDVDDIPAGQAFDQAIAQSVRGSKVLLVLIGPRWWVARDGAGGAAAPRLHDPADFVHQELAAALAGGLRVIPLLFDGATMPTEAQLPPALQPLARRQALVMDARRFAADTASLLAVLREALGLPAGADAVLPARPAAALRRRAWLAAGAVGAVLAAVALLWRAMAPVAPDAGAAATGPAASAVSASAASAAAPAPVLARAAVNGRWRAEVDYDWPNAHYTEQIELSGEGADLHGTASFLRVPRGILQGQVDADGLRFVTRTAETGGGAEREVTHRWRGRLVGDELRLVMQTEGSASAHRPVEMVARRVPP